MAIGDRDDPATEPASKMRTLIRQNSERIGQFAEVAVLPKYRRSTSRTLQRLNSVQSTATTQVTQGFVPLVPLVVVESDAMDSIKMNPAIVPMTEEVSHETSKYFPVFMISLSVIQVVFMYFLNTFNRSPMLLFGYDPYRRYQVWRFITIMLVHTKLSHLITNMLFQLILGVLLEIVHNWPAIAAIYFASVFGGSLFITLLSPNSYAVGASAGVYGLLFSNLSTIILNWNEMDKKKVRLSVLLLCIFVDVGVNLQFTPNDFETNYASHLGGGLTGFLISILVLKNFKKQQWKKNLQAVCVGLLLSLAVIALCVNVFGWNAYLPTEWNEDYQRSYDEFVFERAINSPQESAAREYCKRISKCKVQLNRFNVSSFNLTTVQSD